MTHYKLIFSSLARKVPLLFRGDSHRLVPATGLKASLKGKIINRVFRRFAAFLSVGAANREYFLHQGVPSEKIFFCPHCVDNARFFASASSAAESARQWRSELGIPSEHRVVLFAGKLELKKRPRDLLEAFRRANVKDVSLLMVGNGEQEIALRREFNDANIHFAPFQNQSIMPRTYMAGDIFVLPSYGSGETWGLAVNEAMCMSRPVIVSDHVGCARDLVREKENGMIFPAGDVSALAEALRTAFTDTQRLKVWGENSRRIIAGYDYRAATEGLKKALDSVQSKQRSPVAV